MVSEDQLMLNCIRGVFGMGLIDCLFLGRIHLLMERWMDGCFYCDA